MNIFKPPLGSRINWNHPLSKGLVGCFLFNEGSGNIVCNIANPEYSGTIHNSGNDIVKWVVGGLEDYDAGGEDYVGLGSFLPFDNGISIALSTRGTTLENYDRLIQRASADGAGWSLRYYNNSFSFQDKKISASNNVLTDSIVSAGIEYFVAATSDRVSNLNIYLGTVAGTSTFSDTAGDGGGTDIDIFRRANVVSGNAYLGFIRFVFLWNRELNKDEITLLNANPYCFIEGWDIGADEYVSGSATYDASLSLLIGNSVGVSGSGSTEGNMSLPAVGAITNSGKAQCSAAAALASAFDLSLSALMEVNVSTSLDSALAITSGADAQADGVVSIPATLSVMTRATMITDQVVTLASSMSLDKTAGAVAGAGTILAGVFSQDQSGRTTAIGNLTFPASTVIALITGTSYDVSLALSMKAGMEVSALRSLNAVLQLDQSVGLSHAASAVAGGIVSIPTSVALDLLASCIASAGIPFSSIQSVTVSGTAISATVTTPDSRLLTISFELRTLTVGSEDRIINIGSENRIITI